MPRKTLSESISSGSPISASMRPRHRCRGRLRLARRLPRPREQASMRPRHRCRGRLDAAEDRGRRRGGHRRCRGFNEAAASMPRKTSPILRKPRAFTGFNEAAASMPRKTPCAGGFLLRLRRASMRPRHRCRGRRFSAFRFAIPGCGFNEAAASMPRKTRLTADSTSALLQLQ